MGLRAMLPNHIPLWRSEFFGANAFAFPGGPIVVTDDLVKLLDNDYLTLAVIAHELAHIDQRHSLHQIMEIIGTLRNTKFKCKICEKEIIEKNNFKM